MVGLLPWQIVATADRPVWATDLSAVGSTVPTEPRDRARLLTFHHRLEFVNDDLLSVTFLSRNLNHRMTTSEGPGGDYVWMTALVNVHSGEIQRTKVWANASDVFDLAIVDRNRLAVLDRWGIRLYSDTFEQLGYLKHTSDTVATVGPSPNRKIFADLNYSEWSLDVSPTLKTLAVLHRGGSVTAVGLVDAIHLEPRNRFTTPSFFSSTISDEHFVYTTFDSAARRIARMHVRNLIGSDTADSQKIAIPNCNSPRFLTSDLLIVTGMCSGLFLIDTAGHQVATRHMDFRSDSLRPQNGQRVASSAEPSRNGDKLAVTEFRYVQGSAWRDTGPRSADVTIVVYDAALKPVFELLCSEGKVLAYSLSPDGTLLAVTVDHKLSLYRLTPQ